MDFDGKKISNEIIEEIKKKIEKYNYQIKLAIIWVGDNKASEIYVNKKRKMCEYAGIDACIYHLEDNVKEEDVIKLINTLNNDKNVTGILLQSPVPNGININNCFNAINPNKDIDGCSNVSIGNIACDSPSFIPCTPKGIIKLIEYNNIDLTGKNVVIINRSQILGKPLIHLLLKKNATVTIAHSYTENLKDILKNADLIISGVGKKDFIKLKDINKDKIVIDAGICKVNGKVCGDVESYDSNIFTNITPVPGGVGPMTIAMVLENLLIAKERKLNEKNCIEN